MNKISRIIWLAICIPAFIIIHSCTNLDENVFDQIPQEKFGETQAQLDALIGPLYGGLGDYWSRFELLNCVTDEELAPSRGGDWSEPEWRFLEEHTWPTDFYGFDNLWTWIYNNLTSVNQQLENPNISSESIIAELRVLRAFYHYLAMDNFGNVIIADKILSGNAENPSQSSRQEVYNFVEKELLEATPYLSKEVRANYGRMTYYVAHAILAKLYLNAEVYTGTPQWDKALAHCDTIIASGQFTLAGDFFSNFSITNQNSPEIILATPFDKSKREGFFFPITTMHYLNQLTYELGSTPWNGYCTYAEFYNSFAENDVRREMWLTGQQYDAAGDSLFDDGVPFAYTKEIPAFAMPAGPVARLAGYRSKKYEIQKGANFSQDNDWVIYRLADVYLMRGEAYFRMGDEEKALEDINFIRTKRNVEPFVSPLTADSILAERGRELAYEYHRRQDLIRFGQFTKAWRFKPVSDETREIFPIPFGQIALNPKLVQNPGY